MLKMLNFWRCFTVKTNDKKEQFIKLRAKNYSFDKITQKLEVSKPTLIEWAKEFKKEIANLRTIEKEKLYQQYLMTKETKIEAFGELLARMKEELFDRDLSDVETKDLLSMMIKTSELLDNEREDLSFIVEKEILADEFYEKININ